MEISIWRINQFCRGDVMVRPATNFRGVILLIRKLQRFFVPMDGAPHLVW